MGDPKNCTWDKIEGVARNIFNILMNGDDLIWAKKAWGIIEHTPLCRYSNEQEYYLVLIRLFCLGEMYRIYNDLTRDERYEAHERYHEWVDKSDLKKIRFIVLAGEKFYNDRHFKDGFTEVIAHLVKQEYTTVVWWLIKGFGDENGLISALSGESGEDGMTYEEVLKAGYNPWDATVSPETLRLFEWKRGGFSQSYD